MKHLKSQINFVDNTINLFQTQTNCFCLLGEQTKCLFVCLPNKQTACLFANKQAVCLFLRQSSYCWFATETNVCLFEKQTNSLFVCQTDKLFVCLTGKKLFVWLTDSILIKQWYVLINPLGCRCRCLVPFWLYITLIIST